MYVRLTMLPNNAVMPFRTFYQYRRMYIKYTYPQAVLHLINTQGELDDCSELFGTVLNCLVLS